MRWYLVLLIYIFYQLMMLSIFSYTYWPFVFLIWRSVYSNYLSILKTELFVFLLLSCKCSFYVWDTVPSLVIWFANIFSHSVGCLFHFLSEWMHEGFYPWWVPVYLFIWWLMLLVSGPKNHCLVWGHEELHLCFPLRVL